jgi:hypothetical protein
MIEWNITERHIDLLLVLLGYLALLALVGLVYVWLRQPALLTKHDDNAD